MNLKSWFPIVLAFVLPLLLVYTWWGGFRGVQIDEAERGPYVYAYLMHQGDYANLPATQDKVRQILQQQQLPVGLPINVLLDDPRKVGRPQLRAHAGFLIAEGQVVRAPLMRGEIPRRKVWLARAHAAALLAPSKTYQALHEFLAARQRDISMPSVEIYESPPEIYRMGVLNVEVAR